MSRESLRQLLAAAEDETGLLCADALRGWPADTFERLIALRILVEAEPASEVLCDSCSDQHVEGVTWLPGEGSGPQRAYIVCRHAGRVAVDLGRLRQWRVDPRSLVTFVAGALDLRSPIEELAPGRIWRLGALVFGRVNHDVLFASGLWRPDGKVVVEGTASYFSSSRSVILLVPAVRPPVDLWAGCSVQTTILADVLSIRGGALELERSRLGIPSGRTARGEDLRPKITVRPPASGDWRDVRIALGESEMTILVEGRVETLGTRDAGFGDRRSRGRENRLWSLLRVFALTRRVLLARKGRVRQQLAQSVADLRKRLRELVPIDADPIRFDRKAKGYSPTVKLLLTSGEVFPNVPRGARWEDVSIAQTLTGTVYISIRDRSETFELIELGFGNILGEANASGRVFRSLLARSAVAATNRTSDPALIVNRNLKAAIPGLIGEPLTVVEDVWKPCFTLSSASFR